MKNTQKDDDHEGMEWWNGLTEIDRAWWLGRADSARPVDAWNQYKREGRPRD